MSHCAGGAKTSHQVNKEFESKPKGSWRIGLQCIQVSWVVEFQVWGHLLPDVLTKSKSEKKIRLDENVLEIHQFSSYELKNPTIFNIILWVAGLNISSTKCLMVQVLF